MNIWSVALTATSAYDVYFSANGGITLYRAHSIYPSSTDGVGSVIASHFGALSINVVGVNALRLVAQDTERSLLLLWASNTRTTCGRFAQAGTMHEHAPLGCSAVATTTSLQLLFYISFFPLRERKSKGGNCWKSVTGGACGTHSARSAYGAPQACFAADLQGG